MIIKCKNCSQDFNKKSAEINRTKNNFCSRSCSAIYNNKKYPKKIARKKYFCSKCGEQVFQKNTRCEKHKTIKRLGKKQSWKDRSIEYKIANNLRTRLNNAIKNKFKAGSAIKDLGCTIVELVEYLESKFKKGMTWKNKGRYGWHIDHIVPLSKFDLNDRDQLLKACHYTNLQPLWAKENLRKGRK